MQTRWRTGEGHMTTLPYMDRRLDTPPLLPYKVKVLDDLMGEELRGGSKVDPMGSSGSQPLYRRGLGGGEVVGRGGLEGGWGAPSPPQHLPHPPHLLPLISSARDPANTHNAPGHSLFPFLIQDVRPLPGTAFPPCEQCPSSSPRLP
nr:hypothetical protein ctg_00138 [Ostreid herpesvirus 1]